MGLWFDGVNKVREFDCVLNKEHRNIIADDIPVALFGIHLHRKASHITDSILKVHR